MYRSTGSKLRMSRPLQSMPIMVVPPYLYGVPVYDLAAVITTEVFSFLENLEVVQEADRKMISIPDIVSLRFNFAFEKETTNSKLVD